MVRVFLALTVLFGVISDGEAGKVRDPEVFVDGFTLSEMCVKHRDRAELYIQGVLDTFMITSVIYKGQEHIGPCLPPVVRANATNMVCKKLDNEPENWKNSGVIFVLETIVLKNTCG